VVWARRRSKGAYIIGAALAPIIALGSVVDPTLRNVQEAKQLKNREDDEPGDPPDADDEQLVLAAAKAAAKKASLVHNDEVNMIAPKPTRPAPVWPISILV
jgi:hypothetical protein